jgi:hypothetical protein
MDRRGEMQMVLYKEVERWSEMSAAQLLTELAEMQNFEIECNGKHFQFEVQIVENTDEYVHASVSVDDGRLPFSISPLCQGFIRKKEQAHKPNLV